MYRIGKGDVNLKIRKTDLQVNLFFFWSARAVETINLCSRASLYPALRFGDAAAPGAKNSVDAKNKV
ncbi:hypothetical protein SAMN04488511_10948 [Pedobacter suwonensis]|uniref:Uncharacterized protein n=1 Tax=Pedobacter suwonensis TaxID=332999 RepID=A0A1I0TH63_9SPHI|nr:hypothetical protein [Pedobacter suwonensis]SFA50326.1 hypothetical protein SAMN04488511_10948 [Pedobacter suwonensis]